MANKNDLSFSFKIPAILWLGVGLLFWLLIPGIKFAWSDPWLYVFMVFWPIPVIVVAAILVGLFFALLWMVDKITAIHRKVAQKFMTKERQRAIIKKAFDAKKKR